VTDPQTEPPAELVEAVARAIAVAQCQPGSADLGHAACTWGDPCEYNAADPERDAALWPPDTAGAARPTPIAAVRAYDAEQVRRYLEGIRW
jgi:hypothetical protein